MSSTPLSPMQPQHDGEPVFREPWEAQVFALAVQLSERGVFSWAQWSQALGHEITTAQANGDPDLGDTYYVHWLNTLERLLCEKGLTHPRALKDKTNAWREAYLHTPHGQAVTLDD